MQAYDPATKKVSTQSVQHVFINHDNDLIDVTLALHPSENQIKQRQVAKVSHSNHNPPLITEVIHTTQKHPWLTTHGWTIAGQLHLNDQVQQLDGTTATVVALKIIAGMADMYDLTVSNVHTFAVGTGQFVVHNCPWWPGAGKATRASYSIQVRPGTNVPQAVRDVVLRTALAQNFEGGRSPNNACFHHLTSEGMGWIGQTNRLGAFSLLLMVNDWCLGFLALMVMSMFVILILYISALHGKKPFQLMVLLLTPLPPTGNCLQFSTSNEKVPLRQNFLSAT